MSQTRPHASPTGVFGTRGLAESTQGLALRRHLEACPAGSWGIAIAVGLALPTLFVVLFVALLATRSFEP